MFDRLAVDVFHHEEIDAAVVPKVVQRADVWVIELGDGSRLTLEALTELRIGGQGRREHLDRDQPIQARVARAVDLPHGADANQPVNFVSAEASAGSKGHEGFWMTWWR